MRSWSFRARGEIKMVYKNLIIAVVFLVFGLGVYLLGEKLSKGNHSDGEKKNGPIITAKYPFWVRFL
jgi:hypothetical protein